MVFARLLLSFLGLFVGVVPGRVLLAGLVFVFLFFRGFFGSIVVFGGFSPRWSSFSYIKKKK